MIPMSYDQYFPTYDELNYDAEPKPPLYPSDDFVPLEPVIIHLVKDPYT